MKKIRLLIMFICLASFLLAGTQAREPVFKKAAAPKEAVDLFFDAYVRMDVKAMSRYIHPLALKEFKEMVILLGWQTGKTIKNGRFVSLLEGASTPGQLGKIPAKDILAAFFKSLLLSEEYREKIRKTKLETVTRLEHGGGEVCFFLRVYPPFYASSSRLVTVGVLEDRDGWKVMMNPWLREITERRVSWLLKGKDAGRNGNLDEQTDALGKVAADFLIAPLTFGDKDEMLKGMLTILNSRNISRVVVVNYKGVEVARKEAPGKVERERDMEFPMKLEDDIWGTLVLSYGPRKEKSWGLRWDNDIEAIGTVMLEPIKATLLFNVKKAAMENLEFLFQCRRVEKAWIRKGKVKEWVSKGSGGGPGSPIMAFEIGSDTKTSAPNILFIQYSR